MNLYLNEVKSSKPSVYDLDISYAMEWYPGARRKYVMFGVLVVAECVVDDSRGRVLNIEATLPGGVFTHSFEIYHDDFANKELHSCVAVEILKRLNAGELTLEEAR